MNTELALIKDYYDSNRLSINTSKTTFLHISKTRQKYNLNIKLGDSKLQESEQISFLGVIIDNKLKFNGHYEKVYKKAKNGLNGLILMKNKLNKAAKLNIYHSLIHSHFIYGALLWIQNITKTQLKTLQTIQKKAIRIIFNEKYNAHTSNLFRTSRITKVENIFEKESILLIYKYRNNNLPTEIKNIMNNSQQTNTIGLRSESNRAIQPKRGLGKGDTFHDIIENWNKFDTILAGINNFGELKDKINDAQNEFTECTTDNCYICNR